MRLQLLAEAEHEIESARYFLNEQSPGLGNRFLSELERILTKIVERPFTYGKLDLLLLRRFHRRQLELPRLDRLVG